jgi:DMSO/TMAO reductase YedYZ heme-binding membrane subunit
MSNHNRHGGPSTQEVLLNFRPTRPVPLLGVGPSAGLIDPGLLSGVVNASERAGRAAIDFVDFYCGVFTLVALSLTVMGGVLAMDRMLLRPRHRMQVQLLHRAVAMASVGFLIVHVMSQVLDGHVGPLDAAVPFLAGGRTLVIGFGTIAAQLMILLAATGIVRGHFAYRSRPALWRGIHALAYLCWPIALLHGLQAGRLPQPWVTASYDVCVALVVVALLVRLITSRHRKARGKPGKATKAVRIPRQASTVRAATPVVPAPLESSASWPRTPPVGRHGRPDPRSRIDRPDAVRHDGFWDDDLRTTQPGDIGRRRR